MNKLFIFLLCFYFGSAKIKINDLKVPQSIESGTVDDVILDCDFDANGEEGVEVKWFLNDDINQIYQWIPETSRPPQAMGTIKDNIDATYKISNDRNTMYRALRIVNVSPKLSGNYSCKVSGFYSEDMLTKRMVIYDPADSGVELILSDIEPTLSCEAEGIFPKPNMTVYITNDNESNIIFKEDDEILELDESGLYNVSSTLYFTTDNLTGTFYYICELSIPGTDYQEREKKSFVLESGEIAVQIEEDFNEILEIMDNITKQIETAGSSAVRLPSVVLLTISYVLLLVLLKL